MARAVGVVLYVSKAAGRGRRVRGRPAQSTMKHDLRRPPTCSTRLLEDIVARLSFLSV